MRYIYHACSCIIVKRKTGGFMRTHGAHECPLHSAECRMRYPSPRRYCSTTGQSLPDIASNAYTTHAAQPYTVCNVRGCASASPPSLPPTTYAFANSAGIANQRWIEIRRDRRFRDIALLIGLLIQRVYTHTYTDKFDWIINSTNYLYITCIRCLKISLTLREDHLIFSKSLTNFTV